MITKVNDKVGVNCVSCPKTGRLVPSAISWRDRNYKVERLGFQFPLLVGSIWHHIFSVVASGNFFRLNLDTKDLTWILEETDA